MTSPAGKRVLPVLLVSVCVALLLALGTWQLQRRAWKHMLIAQVAARVDAPAAAPPGPGQWAALSSASAEYRHVRVTGYYLLPQTLVRATTELGMGFWVLQPLRADDGFTLMINRGFVPEDTKAAPADGAETEVTGLLRMSQPGGGFLMPNEPAAGRWYSRDVRAIAAQDRVGDVAPYFIDAAEGPAQTWPRGGLTVITFTDNHLVYALTWFGMALALTIAAARILYLSPGQTPGACKDERPAV